MNQTAKDTLQRDEQKSIETVVIHSVSDRAIDKRSSNTSQSYKNYLKIKN